MFCYKCGKQIDEESKFCSFCGAAVPDNEKQSVSQYSKENNITEDTQQIKIQDQNTEQNETDSSPIKKQTKQGIGKILLGICIIIFMGAFCFGFVIPLHQSKENLLEVVQDAPEQYINYIMDDDTTAQYKQLLYESQIALNENSNKKRKELLEQWRAFEEEVIKQNKTMLTEKQKQIEEAIETSFVYDDEKQQIEQYKTQIEQYIKSENYIESQNIIKQWQQLLDSINDSGEPLQIKVEQIDASEFPKIRFYLDITDTNGQVPKDLPKDMFQLKEEYQNASKSQQILNAVQIDENSNLNINLIADVSGSMDGYPMQKAKNAMQEFLNYIQFSIGDMVELTIFSDTVSVYQPFTNEKNALSQQITQLPIGNMTCLYDALYAAVLRTATQGGAKCVVAFTDGMDNISHCTPKEVIEAAKRYKIPVYIVGIGSELDGAILQNISYETNGFYKQIYDVSGISEFYNQIYRMQKQLYLVEYTSSNTNKIGEHSVNIGVNSREFKGNIQFDFTPNVLTSVDTQKTNFQDGIEEAVNRYLNGFVNAINTSDFSYLEDVVVLDSPFAEIQKKYIQRKIEEKLQSYEITDKEMINENTCIVTVRETYDIDNIKLPLHMLVQEGKYILKKQTDGAWKFYDFAEPVEVLQKLNY